MVVAKATGKLASWLSLHLHPTRYNVDACPSSIMRHLPLFFSFFACVFVALLYIIMLTEQA